MTDLSPSSRNGQSLNDGESQLELLLFDLHGGQLFGINVFRVSEALPCPKLTQLPGSSTYVIGVAYVRGTNIPVIDLSKAIGFRQNATMSNSSIIVCELNKKVYGFLVQNIRQIVTIPWNQVSPPPRMLEKSCCISSIVQFEDKHTVEVIDVEHVLEIVDPPAKGRYDELDWVNKNELKGVQVLVVEDSKIARQHITEFLDYVGVVYTIAENGQEALATIKEWGSSGEGILDRLTAIISDVEMPIMDGLTLVKELRKDHRLDTIAFYFHSTLGRLLNKQVVTDVKATAVIEKGDYQALLSEIRSYLEYHSNKKMTA